MGFQVRVGERLRRARRWRASSDLRLCRIGFSGASRFVHRFYLMSSVEHVWTDFVRTRQSSNAHAEQDCKPAGEVVTLIDLSDELKPSRRQSFIHARGKDMLRIYAG